MTMHNYADYNLPEGFPVPQGESAIGDQGGVGRFEYAEQKKLFPWRIAMVRRPWKDEKVKMLRVDKGDMVPVILFYRDKDNIIPIKLRRKMDTVQQRNQLTNEVVLKRVPANPEEWELPQGYDDDRFQVAFERFKAGKQVPGTPITNWGRCDESQAHALMALGIFSVEQYADLAESEVKHMFRALPPSESGQFLELHEFAIIFREQQAGLVDVEAIGNKLAAVTSRNEALELELEELRAKIKGSKKGKKPAVELTEDEGE